MSYMISSNCAYEIDSMRLHRVAAIAEKRGVSMAQVALAWSLSKPFVTAPIVGTTSIDKLKDLVGEFRPVWCVDGVRADMPHP